jgi:hypothetical protein
MVGAVKNPAKVKAGLAGSASRWGAPRIARLDALPPSVASAIRALIDAASAENAKAASAVDPETALPEVHCHARPAA